jgi:Tfp pilus assembly pilus retraction ATPase PilT
MQRPVEAIDAYEPPSDSFFRALIGTLRLFPAIPCGTILMAGEIPDSRTAIEILKAAASGHLVIATINARSAVDALRIMAMLCAPGGDNLDPEAAREMLAVALKGVWCQRLSWHNQGPDWNRCEISGDLIWSGESVARAIRRGNFESLDNIAKKQNDTIANMRQDRPLGAEEIEKLLWRAETPKLSLDRG